MMLNPINLKIVIVIDHYIDIISSCIYNESIILLDELYIF